MNLGLANSCTWLQVYSVIVYLIVYHISTFCIVFMYMQNIHMVYEELHINNYLVLDQNASDDTYSTPCAMSFGMWTTK